jgi:hypothetical protein
MESNLLLLPGKGKIHYTVASVDGIFLFFMEGIPDKRVRSGSEIPEIWPVGYPKVNWSR